MKREKNKRIIEEKNQNKGEKADDKKSIRDYGKQTKIMVIFMAVLIASIFLVNWIIQESRKFDYNGMNFYEEKEGSIMFYKSLLGYVTQQGENIPFILKLRNDPRKLDEIPVNGSIILREKAILSLSPKIANCSDAYITLIDFSRTLKAFGAEASAATTDKDYSKEHELPLVDCKDAGMDETVIVMKEGNETKITENKEFKEYIFVVKEGEDNKKITRAKSCYVIEIKDCKVQQSFERFTLEIIKNMMVKA